MTLEQRTLRFTRRWWRPLTCVWLCLSVLVNGVVVPLVQLFRTGDGRIDLMALAALVTAIAGAFAVRTYEKSKGMGDDAA